MATHMPKCDLLSCLALPQHRKGLGVLAVLVLPAQQRKTQEHTVHEEESQASCPGWQQCSPFLLAVTKPCSMLTLAPLFPTSPGRPRVPSGPGSPCEKGEDIPGQGALQCYLCAWQCSTMPFSNLVFLGFKQCQAVCPLNVSLNLELCCPSSPLWTKPCRRRLYLVPAGQAAGTVGAQHSGICIPSSGAAWTLHGWAVAHHTHTSPVHLGLTSNNLGSCFTHPFSYASRRAFAAFRPWISTSPLDRHRSHVNGVRGWMLPGQ